MNNKTESKLSEQVRKHLNHYFNELDGETPKEVYSIVLDQVERPLLEIVMHEVSGNQTKASELLGLNRGTLRKKLKQYDLL